MRQELTIFSAGAIFIVLVALIVTISTAVSAIWVGGLVVFLIFALVGAFCFKVTK